MCLEDRSEILGPCPIPVPQEAMVVGKIDERVVILFIGGESVAHGQPL